MNQNTSSSNNDSNTTSQDTTGNSSNNGGGDPTVDTALLETIFYNEMMMMENQSSSLSSNFLAYLSSDPTNNTTNSVSDNSGGANEGGGSGGSSSCGGATVHINAHQMAERDLLRDFGVSSPTPQQQQQPQKPQHHQPYQKQQQQSRVLPIPSKPISFASSCGPARRSSPTGSTTPRTTVAIRNNTMPSNKIRNRSITNMPKVSTAAATVATVATTSDLPPQQLEGTEQLVSQFATLASRLGISLPPNVLSSLTAKATVIHNKSQQQSSANQAMTSSTSAIPHPPPVAVSGTTSTQSPSKTIGQQSPPTAEPAASSPPVPSVVQQLAKAAEAAINAASETRKRSQQQQQTEDKSSIGGAKPQTYSKRRKKPKLTDCEARLAALKDENERLKRHLDNVTNQSHKFEVERKNTENLLRKLINKDDKTQVDSNELNTILSKYTEMYADYGRHRNQELSFHLQQLERLAAPTNFTKMGLWTLGQSEGFYTNPKQNPIAGILRKELGITPAQGRKIIEQRQRIRDLSTNLKKCYSLLAKLKELCEHKQKVFQDRISKCQEILTPVQVAKLIFWVDEHEKLLNDVAPGWGSECIRTNKASTVSENRPTSEDEEQ